MKDVDKIKGSNCSQFTNASHLSFHQRNLERLKMIAFPEKVHITAELGEYETCVAAEQDRTREATGTGLTQEMREADEDREEPIDYVLKTIATAKKSPVAAVKAAGIALEPVANVYGDANGALVVGIQADSPAQKAGLAVWDLIVAVNGKPIKSAAELRNLIGSLPPKKTVTLTFMRNSMKGDKSSLETKQATITLAEQPQINTQSSHVSQPPIQGEVFDGLRIENLNAQIRQAYRVPNDINGVLVSEVQQNSKAANLGFAKGDVIAQIENVSIKNITDFQNAIKAFKNKTKRILAYNILNGEVKTIIVQ